MLLKQLVLLQYLAPVATPLRNAPETLPPKARQRNTSSDGAPGVYSYIHYMMSFFFLQKFKLTNFLLVYFDKAAPVVSPVAEFPNNSPATHPIMPGKSPSTVPGS